MVGELGRQIALDELELACLSFNFEPERSDRQVAILSIVLVHRASGYKVSIKYDDTADALEFWREINAGEALTRRVLRKLQEDGKLPVGEIVA